MNKLLKRILINHTNEKLWNDLRQKYDISVYLKLFKESKIAMEENKVQLNINICNLDPSIFTHELLHLWLWCNECSFINSLLTFMQYIDSENVHKLFDDGFDYRIANQIDHILMHNEYNRLGCDQKKFLPSKTIINERELIYKAISTYKNGDIKHDQFFIMISLNVFESQYIHSNFSDK